MTDLVWRRPSRCGSNACVEVADAGVILVRDASGRRLTVDRRDWARFVGMVRGG